MARAEVLDQTRRFRHTRRLARTLEALMLELGLTGRELTVVLVTDAEIAERNERDRGVAGPTDVLSYPTGEPTDVGFPAVEHLGDVLISLDTAKRQARAAGVPMTTEVVTLAAHGVVHLTGADHTTPAEWRRFETAQVRAAALFSDLEVQRGAA